MTETVSNTPIIPAIAPVIPAVAQGSTKANAIFRLTAYVASAVVMLAALPYIIRALGVDAYGIIGISNSVINYLAIATVAVTAVIGRNLVFAITQKRFDDASKQVSTSLWGLAIFILAVLLPAAAGIFFLEKLLNLPPHLVTDGKLLFVFIFVTFALTTLSLPFSAATFVRNRLDIASGLGFLKQFLTYGLVLWLFSLLHPSLALYGLVTAVVSLFFLVANIGVSRKLMPETQVGLKWVDTAILRGILMFGGWITLNHIGSLLYLQTDIVVVNRVLGAAAAGQFAALAVISTQMRAVGSMVASLFDPNQTALAARGDIEGLLRYVTRSVRIATLIAAAMVGIFCGLAPQILHIWLGAAFAPLSPLALLMTAHLIVNLGVLPLFGVQLALGGVKWPGIVTLVLGLVNILLGITLAGPLKLGLMGVALAGCIVLTAKNLIFSPWYVARLCRSTPWPFLQEQGIGLLMGAAVFLVSKGAAILLHPASMGRLGLTLLLASVLSAVVLAPFAYRIFRKPTTTAPLTTEEPARG